MAKDDVIQMESYFRQFPSVLVAFSGGVDSTVLANAAQRALGKAAVAVTFDTPTISRREIAGAVKSAKRIGIRHIIVKYTELSDERFTSNPHNRCYFCKKAMAHKLKGVAKKHGIKDIVEGTNAQDLIGHRPGYKALKEAGISSPFVELGFNKDDVRKIAKDYMLEHNKPSGACLASRIPTGVKVTKPRLRKVEEAEEYLRALGLTQVRVRLEGARSDVARIEVIPREFQKVLTYSKEITGHLPFRRVTLDLRGYS